MQTAARARASEEENGGAVSGREVERDALRASAGRVRGAWSCPIPCAAVAKHCLLSTSIL
jgi:hypothetical protein